MLHYQMCAAAIASKCCISSSRNCTSPVCPANLPPHLLPHAEVIRLALQFYAFVIEEEEKGGGVSIKTIEDGEVIYRSIF